MKISSLRAFTLIAAAIGWAFPLTVAAQSQGQLPRDTTHITPSGNFLAAREANIERDADAASLYYRAALRTDPKNPELLEPPSTPCSPTATSMKRRGSPIA